MGEALRHADVCDDVIRGREDLGEVVVGSQCGGYFQEGRFFGIGCGFSLL